MRTLAAPLGAVPLLVALGIWIALRGTDEYVLSTIIAYGPRWVWLLPPLLVLPLALWRRRVLVPIAGALLVVAGPVMQFELAVPAGAAEPSAFTVLTFNVQGDPLRQGRVVELVEEHRADVVALQECPADRAAGLREAFGAGWHVAARSGLCLASRYAMRDAGLMDRRLFGGWGAIGSSHTIDAPGGPVAFFNVHLETVRDGLQPVVNAGVAGLDALRRNLAYRARESRLAAAWVASAPAPAVVAGDFNLASDSAIYRAHWRAWGNAFETAGFGYGYTKYTSWSGIRIDHVLHGREWEVVAAAVGPDLGSDHRPVVATLRRIDGPRRR